MSAAVRPYRGISAENRRAERRARLMSACLDVVGECGVAEVTVDAVSARARLTKRYFYESFADLDTLLGELIDDIFTELLAEIPRALDQVGPGLDRRARAIITTLVDFLARDARRARLYVEAPGQAVLRARREQAYLTYTRLLLDQLPAAPAPDPGEADRRALAALVVVAGVTQAAVSWLQSTVPLDRDDIIDELTRIMIATLG